MSSKEFCVTWKDHDKTLMAVFQRLLEECTFVDCTIAAEGQYLKAHKIVLSACSPYFELLFSQETEKNPIIVLKDIKFQELRAIIDFVYCGEVRIPKERLQDFVEAAESLQINSLKDDCKEKMTGKRDNQSQSVQRGKDRTLKWSRKSHLLSVEKNKMNNESYISKRPQTKALVNVPSSQSECGQSRTTSHNSAGSAYSEQTTNDIQSSSPYAMEIPLECIETEPDPVLEVFVPEVECSLDQSEDCGEEMMPVVNSGNVSMLRSLLGEDNTSQYSRLKPVPEVECSVDRSEECREEILEVNNGGDVSMLGSVLNKENTSQYSSFKPVPEVECSVDRSEECREEMLVVNNGGDVSMLGSVLNEENTSQYSRGSLEGEPEPITEIFVPESEFSVDREGETIDEGHTGESVCAMNSLFDQENTEYMDVASQTADCLVEDDSPLEVVGPPEAVACRQLHNGESLFKCEQCGKAFRLMEALMMHYCFHTAEQPFQCRLCNNEFGSQSLLLRHKCIHTGGQCLKCKYCDKSFSSSSKLLTHERVHTGEKPFRCEQCGRTFVLSSSLRRHWQTHMK